MGTPEFAAASLEKMLEAGCEIAAVVTAPDKPAGRGQKISESAVKKYAVSQNIPVLQPQKLKSSEFLESLRAYKADLQVVVAFRMLPEIVWSMPPKGTINLHASLLPDYRGAAPINWAVINGEKETGVTTFFLQHEIDTGNILFTEKVSIEETDTAGIIHDKLMNTGAELLVRTVKSIESGDYKEIPQGEISTENLHHAPKIFKEDCLINWEKPVKEVYDLIRGLSPYPTAFTTFQEKNLKVFKAEKQYQKHDETRGEYKTDGRSYLKFACPDGFISLTEVQLEGKKRMEIGEFLRGLRLEGKS